MNSLLQEIVAGKYQIQPGIAIARDGGTIAFAVKDDSGTAHILFIDRRLDSESKDTFYKDAYPGEEGSVQLGKNDDLVTKVETAIKNEFSNR